MQPSCLNVASAYSQRDKGQDFFSMLCLWNNKNTEVVLGCLLSWYVTYCVYACYVLSILISHCVSAFPVQLQAAILVTKMPVKYDQCCQKCAKVMSTGFLQQKATGGKKRATILLALRGKMVLFPGVRQSDTVTELCTTSKRKL